MEEYRLERHLKLWDNNNKMITKIVFLSLVLSLSLIVKVLSPFVIESEKKKPYVDAINMFKQEKVLFDEKINFIEQAMKNLVEVGHTISTKPWEVQKEKLIQRFSEMNASPPIQGYSLQDYKEVANQTIIDISNLLRLEIIQQLKFISNEADARSLELSHLSSEVSSLNGFDKEWESKYIDKIWYKTLHDKSGTMEKLTNDITDRFINIKNIVDDELNIIKQKRMTVVAKLDKLNSQIKQEERMLESIEKELEEILHEWLQGLVSIKQVIQLLPLTLLCVALYVMSAGLVLTRHYQIYADGKALSSSVKSESSMSSVWTLIHRGRFGTILTVMVYVIFFLFAWLLFEKAIELQLAWVDIDPTQAWIETLVFWNSFLWLSRLIFVGLIGYVLMLSWRRKLIS